MNPYLQLRNSFQFLECAVRQKDTLSRCRGQPQSSAGRNPESALRDYVFCLMLVSTVSQLEADIEKLSGIPGLHQTDKLAPRLRILRDHYGIANTTYDAVDRIRDARNDFVHNRSIKVEAGCTKGQMAGIIVTFLQLCRHPDYQ